MEEDHSELVTILLAELIEDLGGIVKLDATKILNDLKEKKFKKIGIKIKDNVATLEVFDEDED